LKIVIILRCPESGELPEYDKNISSLRRNPYNGFGKQILKNYISRMSKA